MRLKYQKWDKILEQFYEEPNKQFTIRALAKRTNIPSASVQRYLNELKKQGFVTKDNRADMTPYFKLEKTFFLIKKMFKTGLIEYLEDQIKPEAIILFGSARKGEYVKESDIDIFVESTNKTRVNLAPFEKKLKHKIQLFIEEDINKLHKRLLNNVINGIKLSGYIKIR